MRSKKEIVDNWLPRYTGTPLASFGQHILLTNFGNYVDIFARLMGVEVMGRDRPMPNATADGITLINFGMGSANAATVMDLLSAVAPKAALFLGKCGGLKRKNQIGDLVLPIAAVRGEGTSNDYLLPEVPALPAFSLQRAVSTIIRDLELDYWTGTVFTTNRRVWEHDDKFKDVLAPDEFGGGVFQDAVQVRPEFPRVRDHGNLGDEFARDVYQAVMRIAEYPNAWQNLGRGVRRCQLARFEYGLVYRVRGDTATVYAVMHLKRRPGYWRKRLGPTVP